jgi:GNAT superfamily N-acetyltransferase
MIQLAIEVRPAKAADAEALSGFAARVFPLGGRPGADPAHLAAYIAAELTPKRFRELIADKNAVLLIAESGGRIAGYAALVHACGNSQIQAKSPAELRKLYVDPRYHGGGVAVRSCANFSARRKRPAKRSGLASTRRMPEPSRFTRDRDSVSPGSTTSLSAKTVKKIS